MKIHVIADHLWYSCILGLLVPITDGLSPYVQEPLAMGSRGYTGRDLNEKTLASSPVRKSVAYESDVNEGVQRSDCVISTKYDLVFST